MPGFAQDDVTTSESDALVVFCCKATIRRALMSDLLETLQCYGYTPEAQNKIACAFTAAVDLREQDGEWDNEIHDVHGNMGMTMFLGLCHIFEHFHDDLAVVILKARDAHRRFRDLELSEYSNAAVETGITNHALGSKELRRAEEEAASKAAAQAVLALGGPFGGNGEPVAGVWNRGNCVSCNEPE